MRSSVSLTINTVLEAPDLRDDYYCSVLAYSHVTKLLAVGLGDKVWLWSEDKGVERAPPELGPHPRAGRMGYITSLAFSPVNAILAVSRGAGSMFLWSPAEAEHRFIRVPLPGAATYVSFRPKPIKRQSQRQNAALGYNTFLADNEVLLVGHNSGAVSIYFVEWPAQTDRDLYNWHGSVAICATLMLHSQQICGISWSDDGDQFAVGSNDNYCTLYESKAIFQLDAEETTHATDPPNTEGEQSALWSGRLQFQESATSRVRARQIWRIHAAVKAIAFCPWQSGLLAIGGGSNDRGIHFFHTLSGACLATIDCAAQVTSLIWSKRRKEIAATFGFSQPDHPFRIAVYTWPDCRQIIAIPWQDELRALYAIPYPGGPSMSLGTGEGGSGWCTRTAEEGCIVVARSDGSIKFHEIWRGTKAASRSRSGVLGGSDILESLHGIDKDGPGTIR